MGKTKTAADNLCERLIEWGTDDHLRLPWGRDQRDPGFLAAPSGGVAVHPDPP